MGLIRLDVPRVDQDVGICDAKSDLRLAEVEVLHQMESTVLESTGYLFWGGGKSFCLDLSWSGLVRVELGDAPLPMSHRGLSRARTEVCRASLGPSLWGPWKS